LLKVITTLSVQAHQPKPSEIPHGMFKVASHILHHLRGAPFDDSHSGMRLIDDEGRRLDVMHHSCSGTGLLPSSCWLVPAALSLQPAIQRNNSAAELMHVTRNAPHSQAAENTAADPTFQFWNVSCSTPHHRRRPRTLEAWTWPFHDELVPYRILPFP
jgi:hypothetical protein